MALPMTAFARTSIYQTLHFHVLGVTQVRYSRYPPTFVEPVTKKESFESELPFDVSTPVKAAPLWKTSSFTFDPLVLKFINIIQKKGEKDLASNLMRKTFEQIKLRQVTKVNASPPGDLTEIELNPRKIFHEAVENSKPLLGLQNVERGGRTYQVPTPLKESRRRFLAMKWLIEAAKNKEPVVPFYEKLADELLDAYHNTGAVIKRKTDLHKQCEANRAYAHFRFW